MEFWTGIGLFLVAIVFIYFIKDLGKQLPILMLCILIAGLQWIVGPYIEYLNDFGHFKYYMYVDETTYMSYVVPAYFCFVFPIIIHRRKTSNTQIGTSDLAKLANFGIVLLFIGIVSDLVSGFLPSALAFVFYLLQNFKFIGAIILFFSPVTRHRYLFYGAVVWLFLRSLNSGMFHDFILWSTFMFMFWCIKVKPSRLTIISMIFAGLVLGGIIQSIKQAYRFQLMQGYQGNKLELFLSLAQSDVMRGSLNNKQQLGLLNVRLNQGWIISKTLNHVPAYEPFANGETIATAINASLVPRFLNPNKKKAGGRENFEKYTGHLLGRNTSMGLSLVGEAYANYNRAGGMIFMFLWGVFLVLFWRFIMSKTKKNILLLFFLPLFFLQVVKAETELVVVLNHLVKASIIVFLFLWAARSFLGWNLRPAPKNFLLNSARR